MQQEEEHQKGHQKSQLETLREEMFKNIQSESLLATWFRNALTITSVGLVIYKFSNSFQSRLIAKLMVINAALIGMASISTYVLRTNPFHLPIPVVKNVETLSKHLTVITSLFTVILIIALIWHTKI